MISATCLIECISMIYTQFSLKKYWPFFFSTFCSKHPSKRIKVAILKLNLLCVVFTHSSRYQFTSLHCSALACSKYLHLQPILTLIIFFCFFFFNFFNYHGYKSTPLLNLYVKWDIQLI